MHGQTGLSPSFNRNPNGCGQEWLHRTQLQRGGDRRNYAAACDRSDFISAFVYGLVLSKAVSVESEKLHS
jgi:hypothetical protein